VRLAELTQKLRADQQRLHERVERTESRQGPAPAVIASQNASSQEAIESAAKAAVAAAVLPITAMDDVTIRPMQPKPSLFPEPAAEPEQGAPAANFIPPAPERPANRAPRMPRIDELPLPAQNELRAMRGEAAPAEQPPEKRRGLLQRLASVGLGGRKEEAESAASARPPIRQAQRPPERGMPAAPRPVPRADSRPEPVSEFAKRPVHHGLDPHGRQAPVHNSPEDDHLDIPAFLRRQAN
jgi:cell division protein FtsZ